MHLLHEALVPERLHRIKEVYVQILLCEADRFDRLERAPIDEHRKTPKELQLLGCEQSVTPVHSRAQRLLPCRQISCPASQQLEPAFESLQHRRWREHPHASCGQLNRQRKAIQPRADLRYRRSVLRREREVWLHGCDALDEQRHSGVT